MFVFVSLYFVSPQQLVIRLYDRVSDTLTVVNVRNGSALWEAMS